MAPRTSEPKPRPKSASKPPIITVFGSSRPEAGMPAYETACELGRRIAEAGWTVCNGGYGGTMEASARGAAEAGGHTIGVTCSAVRTWPPNAYIRQEVPTFDLHARLNTLVRLARGYVVLPGGSGTLLELALVWELVAKGKLKHAGEPRPIILLGDHWLPVLEPVRSAQPELLLPTVVADAAEAVAALQAHLA